MSLDPYDDRPEREAMEREREDLADSRRDQEHCDNLPDEPPTRTYDAAISRRCNDTVEIRRAPSF